MPHALLEMLCVHALVYMKSKTNQTFKTFTIPKLGTVRKLQWI